MKLRSTVALIILGVLLGIGELVAQNITVDINLDVKHVVGSADSFDRSKYIVFHAGIDDNEWDSDEQRKSFLEDYDVYLGRNNGSILWEYNQVKEDPNKSGWPSIAHMQSKGQSAKSNYSTKTTAHQLEDRLPYMMIGGQMPMYPNGQNTTPHQCCSDGGTPWAYEGHDALAEYYANYLSHYFGNGGETGMPKPKLLEVVNEPFVKAGKYNTTNLEIAKMHSAVAKRVKELHNDVLVGGYTAAHPAFEAHNFRHWDSNWRMFIDEAGEDMDFFSFHLYDYVGDRNNMEGETKRSGSNIEAIMDMINHYSYLSLGEVKPWSISEYGWFCPSCDGEYTPERDWYNLRSFSNMMMQLMERPDQILSAIPFAILKANWAHNKEDEYNSYGPRLMREIGEMEGEPAHGGWVYTEFIKFYQLWSDVKGTRIDTKANDMDILTDAYIDGNKMYLILSSLETKPVEIDLNLVNPFSNTVEKITAKHLFEGNKYPYLEKLNFANDTEKVRLGSEATMILEYTFAENVSIPETSTEKTYYAEQYLKSIVSNQVLTFSMNGIQKQTQGEAMLRLGLGRAHGKSLMPIVKVNGHFVSVPIDWRGDKQTNRESFFGVIEIPVSYDILAENNTVTVQFADGGGHVSSVALKVFNTTRDLNHTDWNDTVLGVGKYSPLNKVKVHPNPVIDILKMESQSERELDYKLFDIQGKQLLTGVLSFGTNQINISTLNAGVYIIKLHNGGAEKTFKINKY